MQGQPVTYQKRAQENIGDKGLRIKRHFTAKSRDPFAEVQFEKRTSRIINPDGTVVFEMENVEVPRQWSQVATDVMVQKYFRKTGVPQEGNPKELGAETSVRQVVSRLAETWRWWGEKYGYFQRKNDAQAFEDELKYILVNQLASPNSPQWFNTGLAHSYGIVGTPQGHYYVDPITNEVKESEDAYTHAQVHACFIQGLSDDLVNSGGIMDLVVREARVFKFGSGTGSNFSSLRGSGEKLSGGGTSSGMMSFLNIFDAAAGSIKSGGTTRRAAKMVCVDIDHPEIEDFISWKAVEEQKVAAIVAGSHMNYKHLKQIVESADKNGVDPDKNPELKALIKKAKDSFVPLNYIKRVLMLIEGGMKAEEFDYRTYDTDFRSEAYSTVGGQNANNSVRVTNEFMEALESNLDWNLVNRTDGSIAKTLSSKYLWDLINKSAWESADPGLQYHTTINEWHTCLNDGEINASNPCSEYMFLDDTACNLASLNLVKFYDVDSKKFDIEAYRHVTRLMTMVLEISVLMSQLPSKIIAERTFKYRTLGLGYANLGALLMMRGIPYESDEGYAITGALTALLTGEAYATSAEMAKVVGPFERYEANKDQMMRVMRNHRRAVYSESEKEYEGLSITPMGINSSHVKDKDLLQAAQEAWDMALALGEEHGYRNAQATCIAPTGTIGLVMDCDTTGIEPDFSLVKFKKLVGGGYFKLVNQSVEPALKELGYSEREVKEIIEFVIGVQSLTNKSRINRESLSKLGFTEKEFAAIEASLPGVYELKYAFSPSIIGEDFCINTLGIEKSKLSKFDLNILDELGFTQEDMNEAEEIICGNMTVEGAPHLRLEHYPVFDCANKCGKKGTRYISSLGHMMQMAAAQPFISGAISKTINLPEEATTADIDFTYKKGWQLMLKAVALYRDASKLSQPLNTGGDDTYSKLFADDDSIEVSEIHQEVVMKQNTPVRKKLPDERHSITHKFAVSGTEGYITVGLYENGNPGEIFITMNKAGSTLNGIMDAFAVSLSMNLQYGVPLETLVRKFTHTRFEPAGITSNKEIPMVKSIVDYIARWVAVKFLDPETAKLYHNPELVDLSYSQGSNARILIPYINGGGHTEIKQEIAQIQEHITQEVNSKLANYTAETTTFTETVILSQKDLAAKHMDHDAPMCTNCGSVTTRQGSCYYCQSCGETTGCS